MSEKKRCDTGFAPSTCLCWKCNNAVPEGDHGCNWSRKLMPVKGWIATSSKKHKGGYKVLACPEYVSDKEVKR